MVAIVLVTVAIALAVPNYTSPPRRNISLFNACINNLRQLDGAAEQWRLENNRETIEFPTLVQASIYIKGGIPTCPANGVYAFKGTNGLPTCSIPGHVLP